jgi:hypothetical protein
MSSHLKRLLIAGMLIATVLGGMAPAAAANAEPPWGFMGLGTSACPNFAVSVDAAKADNKDYLLGYFSWAQGYMSGLNNFLLPKKQLNGISKTAQVAELYKYCAAHLAETFSAAVLNLYDKLPDLKPHD